MQILLIVFAAIAVPTLVALALSRIVQQDQEGVLFRLGRGTGINGAGGADEGIPPGTLNHGR